MSSPTDSETEDKEPTAGEQVSAADRKKAIVDGFNQLAGGYQNVASHLHAYANWLEETSMPDISIEMQVEILQSLSAKLQ